MEPIAEFSLEYRKTFWASYEWVSVFYVEKYKILTQQCNNFALNLEVAVRIAIEKGSLSLGHNFFTINSSN